MKLSLTLPLDYDETDLHRLAAKNAKVDEADIVSLTVTKRSIDARHKRVRIVLTVEVVLRGAPPSPSPPATPVPRSKSVPAFPVVVLGAGPAGMFAALALIRAGVPTVLLERGAPVSERARTVNQFFKHGTLDPESNVLFGEGGAGTFSDGKLYTRTKDARIREVWQTFVDYGAPGDILVDAHPHIGTNKLRSVIPNMRKDLIRLGVDIRFHTRADRFIVEDNAITRLVLADGTELRTDHVVVATGHSARDTYTALHEAGVELEPMPYALGVRIEHPQSLIDGLQYGPHAGHPRLGAAPYRLTHKAGGAYSFCMCPGGLIIGSTQEPGTVVTNGMSARGRSGRFANAGLVAPMPVADHPLGGIEQQRRWERAAFEAGGGGFVAPAQRAQDFLRGVPTEAPLHTSYLPGVHPADLSTCLPGPIVAVLRDALRAFDRKMPGFAGPDAVLVGVESRVSAPLRVKRGDDGQSSVRGLYPVGEGAGFAGGITSAAVDGMRAADRLISSLNRG